MMMMMKRSLMYALVVLCLKERYKFSSEKKNEQQKSDAYMHASNEYASSPLFFLV